MTVCNLALQVTVVDCIEVDQCQGADAGSSEVHGSGAAQPADAHDNDVSVV